MQLLNDVVTKSMKNGNISIVAPIQLSVIMWKCDSRRF